MSQRLIGFVLLAVAIAGIVFAFAGIDRWSAQVMSARGFMAGFQMATTYGGVDLGIVVGALVAVALVGVGLLVFGKKD